MEYKDVPKGSNLQEDLKTLLSRHFLYSVNIYTKKYVTSAKMFRLWLDHDYQNTPIWDLQGKFLSSQENKTTLHVSNRWHLDRE